MTGKPELLENIYQQSRYLTARQKILAQNIANSDTPKYIAKDLPDYKYEKAKSGFSLLLTNSRHVQGEQNSLGYRAREDKDAYEITPDGNRVSLEQQFVKVSETQERFALMNGLTRKWKSIKGLAISSQGI